MCRHGAFGLDRTAVVFAAVAAVAAVLLLLLTASVAVAAPPTSAPAAAETAPAAPVTPPTEAASTRLLRLLEGFHFGSYGRVGYSGDLREGSAGRSINVVSHGPRLEEPPYAELDLGYSLQRPDALSFKLLFTLGLLEDLFHYTGTFELKLALRNLYAEATHVLARTSRCGSAPACTAATTSTCWTSGPWTTSTRWAAAWACASAACGSSSHAGVNRLDDPLPVPAHRRARPALRRRGGGGAGPPAHHPSAEGDPGAARTVRWLSLKAAGLRRGSLPARR